jgi:hypothetical protein
VASEPIRLRIRQGSQIVTPLRFGRARFGPASADHPDIDDRGFAMNSRPFGWGTTDARGAMVGVTEGLTAQIAVLREDIGEDAKLFVTTQPDNLVELVFPPRGAPLPLGGTPTRVGDPHDVLTVRGIKDQAFRCGKIQVRLGSTTGPVLGEMECHIFAPKEVRCVAWLVTIRGIGPNLRLLPKAVRQPGDDLQIPFNQYVEEINKDFDQINAIFRPAGVIIHYQPERTRRFSIDRKRKAGNQLFKFPGKVNDKGTSTLEFDAVINEKFVDDAINLYFVHRALGFAAATFSPFQRSRSEGFGIVVSDSYKDFEDPAHVLAHEIGHFFLMDHPDEIESGPQQTRDSVRGDMWTLRNVDFSNQFHHRNPPHHRDLGYGNDVNGELLTLKDLRPDSTLGAGSHVGILRRSARRFP